MRLSSSTSNDGTLRVDGKQPEIFNAVTGEVHETLLFTAAADHRTSVPLALEPYGSIFLLFRHPAAKNNVTSITRDGTILYSSENPDKVSFPLALAVANGGGAPVLRTRNQTQELRSRRKRARCTKNEICNFMTNF